MKKLLTFYFLLNVLTGTMMGITITIGTDTSTQRYPLGAYWGYERSASLYTSSDMQTECTIHIVSWYATVSRTLTVPMKIYLKETSSSSLTANTWANMISGAALVYDADMTTITANSWNSFSLSTAFAYSGSNNLLVLVETNYGSNGSNIFSPGIRYSTAANSHETWTGTNDPPTGSGTIESSRPNIQFDITTTSSNIFASPGSLNFGFEFAGSTSAEKTFILSGVNLIPTSGNITITPPANFEVSLTSGSGFSSSPITKSYSGGTLSNTIIYVVFKPTSPNTSYSGNITNSGGGSATKNVAVRGSSHCDRVMIFPWTENFEDTVFAPDCWTNVKTSGTGTPGTWDRQTSGTNPTCTPYNGTGMARYYSYNYSTGTKGILVTPPIALAVDGYKVKFQMYRDDGYPTNPDLVNVYYNTTNNLTGATLFGTVNRSMNLPPVVSTAGWHLNSLSLPAGSGGSNVFIIFEAVSGYGNNIFIDRVSISQPPPNDVGTVSIDLASSYLPGTITPQATIKNFGTESQSFNVQMTITGGYSSTKAVTNLAPGATVQVRFAQWSAASGSDYMVKVWTQLVGDADTYNDTLNKIVAVYNGVWLNGAVIPSEGKSYLGSGVGYAVTSAEATNGYLFSIGGNTTSGLGTECYKYDVNADTWTAIASLPEGRRGLATALVGDFVYAIGGENMSSVHKSTVFKYDIAGNSWSTIAPLPEAIVMGKAVGYNNKIYFAGGMGSSPLYRSSVYVYDIAANTWNAGTPMPGPKYGGAFSVTDGKLVYVAGANATVVSSDVYVGTISPSNPLSISWITADSKYPGLPSEGIKIGSLNSALELFVPEVKKEEEKYIHPIEVNYPVGAMFKFDGAPWGFDGIIVAGGTPTTGWSPANPNPCYVYKPSSDTWIKQINVPTRVLGSSLGSVNMGTSWKLIVATGYTGAVTTDAVQIYSTFTKSLNLGLIIEGLYDGTAMVPDIATIEMRNASSPFDIIEKCEVQLNSSGNGTANFLHVTDETNYYIAIKHRNSIETWSKLPQQFSGGLLNYNFTTAQTKAFGDNMKLKGSKWCIYSGDVSDGIVPGNQDGYIDIWDDLEIYNDSYSGIYRKLTDLTGDGFVDIWDDLIVYNNSLLGITAKYPNFPPLRYFEKDTQKVNVENKIE